MSRPVIRGGAWSAGGQAVTLVVSLVATPFTVRLLGPSAYGLLTLINVIVAYVSIADLGMGAASTRFGAKALADGDDDGEAKVVWTAVALAAGPALVIAGGVCLAARSIAEDLLNLPASLQGTATVGIRVVTITFVARVVANVLNTPQLVRLRWGSYTVINTAGSVVQVAAVPIVVAMGGGVVAAVLIGAIAAVGISIAHLVVSSRLQTALLPPRVDRALVRPLARFGGALVLSSVAAIPLANAERFFLARTASLQAVAHYAVAATAAAILAVIPLAVAQPLLPAFTRQIASGHAEEWAILYRRVTRLVMVALVPIALALCVIARPFFTVWAGTGYGESSTIPFYILVAGIVVNGTAYAPSNLLLAMGRADLMARCHLVELPLFFAAAALSTARWGATGAALAWSLRVIGDAGALTVLAQRVAPVRLPLFPLDRRGYGSTLAPLLPIPISMALLPRSWWLHVGLLVALLPLHGVMLWRRVLEAEERGFFLTLRARVAGRRR